ncbi:MAG: 6,7-dimethyl-8-ribityllumazine synthase [Bacteroidota bacterium]
MASNLKNLSEYNQNTLPKADNMKFGIVVSEWNAEVTDALAEGAYQSLLDNGVSKENIIVKRVPGSFELVLGAQLLLENTEVDSVLCLGCVIQGETRHFDFICDAVSNGIMKLNMEYNCPVIFGLLTTNTLEQAKERSGGKHGNKGIEAAITAIKMVGLINDLEK